MLNLNEASRLTPEDEIRRAGRSKEVLENEIFKEAFDTVEQALLAGIRAAAFTDDKLREKLAQRYAALHDIRFALVSVMETGEMAREQMSLMQRAKKVVGLN